MKLTHAYDQPSCSLLNNMESVPKELRNLRACLVCSLVKVRCLGHVQKLILVPSMMKWTAKGCNAFLTCHFVLACPKDLVLFFPDIILKLSVQISLQIFSQCP